MKEVRPLRSCGIVIAILSLSLAAVYSPVADARELDVPFRAIVPNSWTLLPRAPDSLGRRFISPSGDAWLWYFAVPVQAQGRAPTARGQATYEARGGDWIVTSGNRGDRIFYSYKEDHENPITIASIYADAKELGYVEAAEFPAELNQIAEIRIDISRTSDDLAARTMAGVRKTFTEERKEHRPSEAHYDGLEEIAKFVQGAANAQLEPCFYISSLPTGIGKTTTLIQAHGPC